MRIILLFFFSFLSFFATSHETDRELSLKATNDELSLRVAELLEENKNLKEFARKALIAKSNNKTVYSGCDTQHFRRIMVIDDPTYLRDKAKIWIDENHAKCTKDQLTYIIKHLGYWSSNNHFISYLTKYISYYRDQK